MALQHTAACEFGCCAEVSPFSPAPNRDCTTHKHLPGHLSMISTPTPWSPEAAPHARSSEVLKPDKESVRLEASLACRTSASFRHLLNLFFRRVGQVPTNRREARRDPLAPSPGKHSSLRAWKQARNHFRMCALLHLLPILPPSAARHTQVPYATCRCT